MVTALKRRKFTLTSLCYLSYTKHRLRRAFTMGCVEISNNDRVWEILYASVFLEGKEREEALRCCGVTLPTAATMA